MAMQETAYGLQCIDNWLASPSGIFDSCFSVPVPVFVRFELTCCASICLRPCYHSVLYDVSMCQGEPITPDLIYFNFGMHDYTLNCTAGYGCTPGQSGNASVYPGELTTIAQKILNFANSLPKKAQVCVPLCCGPLCRVTVS